MTLSPDARQRYRCHLAVPDVGAAGQAAFAAARLLVVGVGGLGCPAATYLVAAGVGTVGLVDDDRVDLTNLHRQVLYRETDLGRAKVEAAAAALGAQNSRARIVPYPLRLGPDNAADLVAEYDLVVNGCDNFVTRYLLNDACVLARRPLVDGAVYRWEGQVTVYDTAAGGPCYRCRFPHPPADAPSCADAGVLGVLPGIIGALQAAEALKLILRAAGVGQPQPLIGRVACLDAMTMEWTELPIARRADCVLCGDHPSLRDLRLEPGCAGLRPGELSEDDEVSAPELAAWLTSEGPPLLLDVREPSEWQIAHLEGARLMPLSRFDPDRLEHDRDRPIVTYCHLGLRSLEALRLLRRAGFCNVRSLRGGIDAWSRLVDPRVPRY